MSFLSAASCHTREESDILVFAGSSLMDAFEELGREYETIKGTGVTFSYGGSQMLAQQIANGAPADLFIPAGNLPINFLREKKAIMPEVVDLLSNRLVVVVRSNGTKVDSMRQLTTPSVGRLAIAVPDLAPAGWYARTALINLKLWDDVQKKLVLGPDVRATLAYVENYNADAALVYKTDAMIANNVTVLDIVPDDSYPQIVYPVVVVRDSTKKAEAINFIEFLRGKVASETFLQHGFQPVRQ